MTHKRKPLKGDVIASILIAIVNIVGGLAIGVGQRNLSLGDALRRYGLLTIGNGLVTQIPALILATAAGILVTRVASEEASQSLGAELGAQLLGAPRALLVASIFIVGLGLVPGLPLAPFSLIGVFLFFASRARASHLDTRSQTPQTRPIVHPTRAQEHLRFVPVVVPWSIQLGSPAGTAGVRQQERPVHDVVRAITDVLREKIFLELGVPLPECTIEYDQSLTPNQLRLMLHEVMCLQLELSPTPTDPASAHALMEQLAPVMRKRAAEFLGMAQTQDLLTALERVAPETVRQVVPKAITLSALSEILRRLVEEGISIRDLSAILQALSQASVNERDPLALTESVRAELRRSTTHQLTAGASRLGVVLLDPSLEEVVRAAISRSATGAFLALAPSAATDIVHAISRAVDEAASKHANTPVLLAAPDTRRFIRRLLEAQLPELRVISPAELLPEIALETWAVATVANL